MVAGTPEVRALSGDEARATVIRALSSVHRSVGHLEANVGSAGSAGSAGALPARAPGDGDLFRCDDLVGEPELLELVIRQSGLQLGTDRIDVAASLFILGWSYRVMALAVVSLATTGVVPDSDASHMAVGLSGPWPSRVSYVDPGAVIVDRGEVPLEELLSDARRSDAVFRWLAAQAIEGHLGPMVAAVHSRFPVGARMLWGNVAASVATSFQEVRTLLGPWAEQAAANFLAVAPPEVRAAGSFLSIEHAGSEGWFWERRSCCLWYKVPGPWSNTCTGCSLTPAAQRIEQFKVGMQGQR